MENAYLDSGYKMPIRHDAEGYPLCPEDGLRLVEESAGYWICPLTLAAERALLRVLEAGSNVRYDACDCPCHDVIQPGLVSCPNCEHSSRYDR